MPHPSSTDCIYIIKIKDYREYERLRSFWIFLYSISSLAKSLVNSSSLDFFFSLLEDRRITGVQRTGFCYRRHPENHTQLKKGHGMQQTCYGKSKNGQHRFPKHVSWSSVRITAFRFSLGRVIFLGRENQQVKSHVIYHFCL